MAIKFPEGATEATLSNGPQNGAYTLGWAGEGKWADKRLWKWHLRRDGVTMCNPSTHQTFLPQHYWIVEDKLPAWANKCQMCEPGLAQYE